MAPSRTVMTPSTNDSARKGLWLVYAFGVFSAAGILLAILGVRTCV